MNPTRPTAAMKGELMSHDTVAWLHQELDRNALTVSRLRSWFGLKTSEKDDIRNSIASQL